MDLHVLNLDDRLTLQTQLLRRFQPTIHDLRSWGPVLRLCCGFRRFRQFEGALAGALASANNGEPSLHLIGSGDFHHVSLALLRRIEHPFNLLILDNHPDWMCGIPFLHCGTWVHHACQLPNLQTIFHVGGDVDFDNRYRWLAPWQALRSGKIRVIPAVRSFERGAWSNFVLPTLRIDSRKPATMGRIKQLVEPWRATLGRVPLYVSLDKDVLTTQDAVVNWDSGHLALAEVEAVLNAFVDAAHHRLAGMDIVGDWSPVRLNGLGQRLLHLIEHPRQTSTPAQALQCNQRTNAELAHWALNWASEGTKVARSAGLAAGAAHFAN
jgi:hypothetical protein